MFDWLRGLRAFEPTPFYVQCVDELKLKQQANTKAWGFGNAERWDANYELETIQFTFADGRIVTAPMQVIGTFAPGDSSWLWAWDNPSLKLDISEQSRLVRAFGEKYLIRDMTTPKITCSQVEAWSFTAVACHLGKAAGAYRGPGKLSMSFMTFGAPTIHRRN
jgi:hypothetical protein